MSLLGTVFSLGGMVLGGLLGSFIPGIGTAAGISIGAAIGGALGGYIGNILFPDKLNYGDQPPPKPYENRIQIATYGAAIPITYESVRLAGNIIYMQPIQQTITHSRHRQDGIRYHQYERIYTSTFAIAFCEGIIEGFRRIWINNDIWIDWSDATSENYTISEERSDQITIYLGTQNQTYDANIASILTAAETPAYKGIAYIVFKDFPIGEYGGMPKIEVEIGPKDIADSCSEYFNGVDGSAISSTVLSETYASGTAPTIQSNGLEFYTTEASQRHEYETGFAFTGAFDVVIDFTLSNRPAPVGSHNWVQLSGYGSISGDEFVITYAFNGGTPDYYETYDDYFVYETVERADSTGKLRVLRNSSNEIFSFYWSGTQWEWNGSTSGQQLETLTESIIIGIAGYTDDVSKINVGDFITVSGCNSIE